ncbi:substrate-binding domain-containing protein [Chlorogloeopsis fritschii PCC 9212]|uniref:substrate-binding domain-containing protein n=1 Tax=Chlorogloeopsis fritschii TaxID=1124 RepID=UPI00370D93C4
MWQKDKKDSSIVNLALLLTLATTPMTANLVLSEPALAQSAADVPSFSLPSTVPSDTVVRIDGSSSMATINQTMKERFEQQFAGARVEVAANGTEAALKALQEGTIDIAAIGRGLTPEEKAQGLEQVRLRREKIAIVVGADNPFKGSLTNRQFARIFRGQITNWSQLGRRPGKIRVIDRPATNESRQAFRSYPAFRRAKFATGATATQLTDDNTAEVIKQLGKDGISYVLASQISKLEGVRVLRIHNTLPEDSRYPFSQPFVYVYKKNSSPNVSSFLGFATNSPGKQAVQAAMTAEAEAIAASLSQGETQTPATATVPFTATATPTPEEIPATSASPTTVTESPATVTDANIPTDNNQTEQNQTALWWLVLPVLGLGGILLWLLRRKPKNKTQEVVATSEPTPALEETRLPQMAGVGAASNGATQIGESNLLQKISKISSHQNQAENLTHNNGNSVAAGATLLSSKDSQIVDRDRTFTEVDETTIKSTPPVTPSFAETTGFDLEAPVTVVRNSYTPLPDSLHAPAQEIPPTTPTETTSGEQLFAQGADTDLQRTSVNNSDVEVVKDGYPSLPDVWEDISEEKILSTQVITTYSEPPDVPQISLDAEVKSPQEDPTPPTVDEIPETQDIAFVPEPPNAAEVSLPDLETPNIIDSTAYPPLPDVWEEITQQDVQSAHPTAAIEELPDVSNLGSDLETSVAMNTSAPELPDLGEDELGMQAQAGEDTVIQEDTVYQELSTPSSNVLEDITQQDSNSETDSTIGPWATIYGIHDNENLNAHLEIPSTDETALVDKVNAQAQYLDVENRIVLVPRTPKWAYVCWQVADTTKEMLRQRGGSQFALRLYDVTGIDLSYQTPVLVQQYECEETICDRYVAIPASDRDYMAELGYVTDDSRWLLLARSGVARVFNRPEKDFWFIADAELIIHGATEPGSNVNIGGHPIKLKPDGTFHLRIPFTDSLIEYVMNATAADSEKTKSIRVKFFQETPTEYSES